MLWLVDLLVRLLWASTDGLVRFDAAMVAVVLKVVGVWRLGQLVSTRVTQTDEAMNRGWLKHGNPPGDPSQAPRCGARTRKDQPCRAPAVRGKRRCRMHGGRSTGPRTPAGRERSTRARWTHGRYSAERQREFQQLKAEYAAFNAGQAAYWAWLFAAAKALLRAEAKAARNARQRRTRRAERLRQVEWATRQARVREAQTRLAARKAFQAASGDHPQRGPR